MYRSTNKLLLRRESLKNKVLFSLSACCLLLSAFSLSAQQIHIDINETTQNRIMSAPIQNVDMVLGLNKNNITIITNDKQIPSFSLYQNEWDTLNVSSEKIEIPFFDEQIKIILVQEGNTPFAFPISSTVSTGFVKNKGRQHTGVDFTIQKREPIVACFDGVVRISKKFEEYGNTVVIRHYNGLETVYALLDQANVVSNQKVKAGELIGYVGITPDKQSAMHFETRFFNEFFNPELMINFSERKLKDNMLTLTPKDFISVPIVASKPIIKQKEVKQPETLPKDFQENSEYHTVAKGETIYGICAKYNITEEQLRKLNQIKGNNLFVGQKLKIR